MALTKFRLVNTQGLRGLQFEGSFIAFAQLDDELAERLVDKTHVLERLPAPPPARPKTKGAGRRRPA